jgi:FKBP-type peptidyl-prolyl cis-trans isomerase
MKKVLIVGAIALMAFGSCNRSGGNRSDQGEMDSVAYLIGLDLGRMVKQTDSTLNVNKIAEGIADALAGTPKMSRDEAYDYLTRYFNIRVPQKNLAASKEFLDRVAKENANVRKTASGLLYEIVTPGDSVVRATADTDTVQVVYTGTLPDGTLFDSAPKGTDSLYRVALDQTIKGWAEGLKLVGRGGKIRLYVPSDLAYGDSPRSRQIGANQALVFDVEVIDVTPEAPKEEE